MFDNVLMPMLATTEGRLIVSSTPWGQKSKFYEFCKGKLKDRFSQHHITWREAVASGIISKRFIEDRKESLLPQRFTMEYEAEFIADIDAWLPQDLISRCIEADLELLLFESNNRGKFYVGIDFGKHLDFSVVAVVQDIDGILKVIHVHRFPLETSYASVIGYVKTLCDRWQTIQLVCPDMTGVGEYIVEDMTNAGIPNVEGITFTVQKKEELATILKEKMMKGELKIPYDRDLINELNVERYELKKTGHIQFSHPENTKDDRFWALALAVYASATGPKHEAIVARPF